MVSPHFGQVKYLSFKPSNSFVTANSQVSHYLYDFLLSETEAGIFRQILRGKLDFESEPWPSISDSAKDLVRNMLTRDPKKRFSAHEVLCKYIPPLIYLM